VVGTAFYLNYNFESVWLGVVCFCGPTMLLKNFEIFFLLQINFFLMFLDRFDLPMSKIKKYIYFHVFLSKNTLKNNHYYNAKHFLNQHTAFLYESR